MSGRVEVSGLLRETARYLRDCFRSESSPRTSELAARLGMSPVQFSRAFAKSVGGSPSLLPEVAAGRVRKAAAEEHQADDEPDRLPRRLRHARHVLPALPRIRAGDAAAVLPTSLIRRSPRQTQRDVFCDLPKDGVARQKDRVAIESALRNVSVRNGDGEAFAGK